MQIGEEECLAKQLAKESGIKYKPWILVYVKTQVRDAYETLELDARLAGSATTPSVQRIHDAPEAMRKAKDGSSASTG